MIKAQSSVFGGNILECYSNVYIFYIYLVWFTI